MLNLFMQVPGLVRKRLAKRCKEVYEYMVMAQAVAEEGGDDDDMPQVLHETRGQGWETVLCMVCVSESVRECHTVLMGLHAPSPPPPSCPNPRGRTKSQPWISVVWI